MSMDIEDFIKEVKDKIPDQKLREFVFGGRISASTFTSDKLIIASHNILRLAFIMVYKRFEELLNLPRCKNDEAFKSSRVSEALFAAYTKDEITPEMVTYVLTEILVNQTQSDDKYKALIDDQDEESFNSYDCAIFSDLLKIINCFHVFSGHVSCSGDEIMQKFRLLLSIMRFFIGARFTVGDDGIFTLTFLNNKLKEVSYRLSSLMFGKTETPLLKYAVVHDYGQYFYLLSVVEFDNKNRLNYVSLSNAAITTGEDAEKNTQAEGQDNPESKKPQDVNFLRRLFTENYLNLKECAFVIIDAIIGEEDYTTANRIEKAYLNEHPEIFKSCRRDAGLDGILSKYNWDNLITLLLAQCGPSDFLDNLLDLGDSYNFSLFADILEKIDVRYRRSGADKKSRIADFERISAKQKRFIPEYLPDLEKKMYEKENNVLICRRIIVTALEFALYGSPDDNQRRRGFRASAQMRYKIILEKLKTLDVNKDESAFSTFLLETVRADLRKTLRFLIVFYEGLADYGCAKYRYEKSLLAQTENCKPEGIGDTQYKAQLHAEAIIREADYTAKFEKKAHVVIDKIKSVTSLKSLNEIFIELCKSYNADAELAMPVQDENGEKSIPKSLCLYKVINRKYILDLEQYRAVTSIPSDILKYVPDDVSDVFDFIDKFSSHNYPNSVVKTVIEKIKNYYIYLVFATDYKNDGVVPEEKDIDPIYPYIIKYQDRVVDKDKYNKNTFLTRTTSENYSGFVNAEIKILTDKEYDRHEHFYALPRREGSTPSLWITPFMIPCSTVNEIIREEKEGNVNAAPNA